MNATFVLTMLFIVLGLAAGAAAFFACMWPAVVDIARQRDITPFGVLLKIVVGFGLAVLGWWLITNSHQFANNIYDVFNPEPPEVIVEQPEPEPTPEGYRAVGGYNLEQLEAIAGRYFSGKELEDFRLHPDMRSDLEHSLERNTKASAKLKELVGYQAKSFNDAVTYPLEETSEWYKKKNFNNLTGTAREEASYSLRKEQYANFFNPVVLHAVMKDWCEDDYVTITNDWLPGEFKVFQQFYDEEDGNGNIGLARLFPLASDGKTRVLNDWVYVNALRMIALHEDMTLRGIESLKTEANAHLKPHAEADKIRPEWLTDPKDQESWPSTVWEFREKNGNLKLLKGYNLADGRPLRFPLEDKPQAGGGSNSNVALTIKRVNYSTGKLIHADGKTNPEYRQYAPYEDFKVKTEVYSNYTFVKAKVDGAFWYNGNKWVDRYYTDYVTGNMKGTSHTVVLYYKYDRDRDDDDDDKSSSSSKPDPSSPSSKPDKPDPPPSSSDPPKPPPSSSSKPTDGNGDKNPDAGPEDSSSGVGPGSTTGPETGPKLPESPVSDYPDQSPSSSSSESSKLPVEQNPDVVGKVDDLKPDVKPENQPSSTPPGTGITLPPPESTPSGNTGGGPNSGDKTGNGGGERGDLGTSTATGDLTEPPPDDD